MIAHIFPVSVLLIFMLSLSSCQQLNTSQKKNHTNSYHYLSKEDKGNRKYQGHYKVGQPYKIKGSTYKPKEVHRYNSIGVASWYGKRHGFHGKKTANGDIYNKEMLTAAHKTLPLPSLVKVTNRENKKSIIVLVNDRGPFAKNRVIDLSERAAAEIGMKKQGTAKVKLQYLNQETQSFLRVLGLEKKNGYRTTKCLENTRCSVNCHIKLVNMKHNLM